MFTISTRFTDSFNSFALPQEVRDVQEALPQLYHKLVSNSTPFVELEVRVSKTLSNGVRRVAIRAYDKEQPRLPIYSTSPAVLLGRRRARQVSRTA